MVSKLDLGEIDIVQHSMETSPCLYGDEGVKFSAEYTASGL